LELLEGKRGYLRLRLPIEQNRNHLGILNACSQFALAGVPVASILHTLIDMERLDPIIVKLNIKYLKRATTDLYNTVKFSEELVSKIKKDLKEKGKSRFLFEEELKDETGEVVTVTKGDY